MDAKILTLFFLIYFAELGCETHEDENFLQVFEDKLETKFNDYANYLAKKLANFNDKRVGNSELGRLLHYEEIKTQLEQTGRKGMVKKMSMALMPLIFQVGATSTWMVITAIMTAKSVAIGLALLVFKIAVSSAKVASFFTLLKSKHHGHHDHHHEWAWSPHYEHYGGHGRSLTDVDHSGPPDYYHSGPPDHHHSGPPDHHHDDWHSYKPEWTPNEEPAYKTIPVYKDADQEIEMYGEYEEKPADRKKDKKRS